MDASTARGEVLADFAVPSETGNERIAMARVARAVAGLGLSTRRLDALTTAVAEATMNAIEHGNHDQADVPVLVRVRAAPSAVTVTITDHGGLAEATASAPAVPDLDAKLAGLQSPRGWGLFLIRNMVDELAVSTQGSDHTVTLMMRLTDDLGRSAETEDGHAAHL